MSPVILSVYHGERDESGRVIKQGPDLKIVKAADNVNVFVDTIAGKAFARVDRCRLGAQLTTGFPNEEVIRGGIGENVEHSAAYTNGDASIVIVARTVKRL